VSESDNIVHISNYSNNSFAITPTQLVAETIKDLETEGSIVFGTKKMLIICLDDSNDEYNILIRNAGLKTSETIALLDLAKKVQSNCMGY